MSKEIFNRFEIKYPMNIATYNQIIKCIEPHFAPDTYGDEEGFYSIINLYFDTIDNFFHEQNINHENFRQKLRLRIYDSVSLEDSCYLEIKKKYDGVSNKRRTNMKLSDAYDFLGMSGYSLVKEAKSSNDHVLMEIDYFKNFYQLVPKSVISYDRKALQGLDDFNLRVTFDKNLRTRSNDLRLEHGKYGEKFTDEDFVLMEVKAPNCVPIWLVEIINEFGLSCIKFSKYSNCVSLSAVELKDEVEDEVEVEELMLNNIV